MITRVAFPHRTSALARAAGIAALGCLALTAAPGAAHARRYPGDAHIAPVGRLLTWDESTLRGLDAVGDAGTADSDHAADVLSLFAGSDGGDLAVRVDMVSMTDMGRRADYFRDGHVHVYVLLSYGSGAGATILPDGLAGSAPLAWQRAVRLDLDDAGAPRAALFAAAGGAAPEAIRGVSRETRFDLLEARFARPADFPVGAINDNLRLTALAVRDGKVRDILGPTALGATTYEAHTAFYHHGNQSLAYTTNFLGDPGRESASGYDEQLQIHEATHVPGNFELGGTLQAVADWQHAQGDTMDFNGWLKRGVTAGWAAIGASPYGQSIMPFLQDSMNAWSSNIANQMANFRYGYWPKVWWVPERVWLSGLVYPNGSVIANDVMVANQFKNHGASAIVLDDDPACRGYDNHQIHTLSNGTGLRVVPRDANYTGLLHSGNGAGALGVLQGLASGSTGPYRIVTYADDWEMPASLGEWKSSMPMAKETYDWMINKCQSENSWLHTWDLSAALTNANFNGSPSMNPTFGTYGSIGGTNGYGGNNNSWYSDWAGYVPGANGGVNGGCGYVGGNCKNYGALWNDAWTALSAAPANTISESGWYTLMTNLYETGWHDYLGGPISGWEHNNSAHIKQASIYAEAARWAGGLYVNPAAAYFSDIDNDGYQELVLYNDRVFAVFEANGGRAVDVFAKGNGYAYSVIGDDNVYWYGTQADYNDGNHVGALSDVSPNQQDQPYTMSVVLGLGSTVSAKLVAPNGLIKTVSLTLGQPYLDVVYQTGTSTNYVQSGFSPDMVNLVWNGQMSRVWSGGATATYSGYRNPNSGATGAWVWGTAGATFNKSFSATLMKGDEIRGAGTFEVLLYAGVTSTPDPNGKVAELDTLAGVLVDRVGPIANSATWVQATGQLSINFGDYVQVPSFVIPGIGIDSNNDGVAEVTLDASTQMLSTGAPSTIKLQTSASTQAAINSLAHTGLRLLIPANAARDLNYIGNAQVTNADNLMLDWNAPTAVTIDGKMNFAQWTACTRAVSDSLDSQWTANNEIDGIYCTWDSLFLYFAIDATVTANSLLFYLDTDPGGPNGQTDLRNIDIWDRNAQFTAPGFKADWQYGSYQHQGVFDSEGFWRIVSATHAVDSTSAVLMAYDPKHFNGTASCTELAIPWNSLYSLGANHVPANCAVSFVASVAWDTGDLGGDSAPSNTGGVALPIVNKVKTLVIDANGDGVPDVADATGPSLVNATAPADTQAVVLFSELLDAASAQVATNYVIYQTSNPTNTVSVTAATLGGDGKTVTLKTGHQDLVGYTLSVSGVRDSSCARNVIAPNSLIAFQGLTATNDPQRAVALMAVRALPNPSRHVALLAFDAPAGPVRVAIYDAGGREVRRFAPLQHGGGAGSVLWDGRTTAGASAPAGMYVAMVSGGGHTVRTRLIRVP